MSEPYKANRKQALAHKAFLVDNYKRGVLFWGRQSGKTWFATQHAWISAVKDQGRYFIVFATYKQAHEVIWRQYLPFIPKELIHKTNEQDLLIELKYIENTPLVLPNGEKIVINHDKSRPRSTIQLLGSDQADSHRGFRAHGIIFDEYADQNPNNWSSVYEPMFTTTGGWAIFMGTPRGYNHFYDMVTDAQATDSWFFQKATWRDSPYVHAEAIKLAEEDATRKGTLSTFKQEYELEFRSVQGSVYPDFSRDVHLVGDDQIPDDLTYYGAIDFGWHTTAFLLIGIDKDQNWWIVDEVYGKEDTLDNIIPRIKNKVANKRLTLIVADSANRDGIEVMQRHFPIVGVNKASDSKGYATGISLITEKLKPRMQLVGMPKPSLFIHKLNKNLIFEIESYRFPEEKENRNPTDIPVKENDHGCFIAGTIVNGKPIESIGQYMGDKKVYEYYIAGTKFTVTPEHPILTNRGLVPIDTLRYDDIIWQKKSFTMVMGGQETPVPLIGAIGCIISALARQIQAIGRDSIAMSGGKQTVKYPLAVIFIILMAIPSIMNLIILAVLSLANTKVIMPLMRLEKKMAEKILNLLSRQRQSGQKLPKGKNSEAGLANKMQSTSQDTKSKEYATCVTRSTLQKPSSLDGVIKTVEPLRYVGVAPTYNLVTRSGMYRANGIVFSNCDALRYLMLHLKFGTQNLNKPIKGGIPSSITLGEYGL